VSFPISANAGFDPNTNRFGGTDGTTWFNDVWCYNPISNRWSKIDCVGHIPAPREGHAAALVEDVMYVFGGRLEDGSDLGDLCALRISERRWYNFQNMEPSPSPRSGHGMIVYKEKIILLGGEPSTRRSESRADDLVAAYILDTSQIRYPTIG